MSLRGDWKLDTSRGFFGVILSILVGIGCGANGDSNDPTCDTFECPENASCVMDGTDPSCQCDDGYSGDECDECAAGYEPDEDGSCRLASSPCSDGICGDHGACDDSTGEAVCTCEPGYSGDHCESCYPGYHDDGTGTCVLDEQCLANTCDGHGQCDDSAGLVICSCDVGYAGDHCESCAEGYHRDDEENCVPNESCKEDNSCGEHGTCDDSTGVIECHCEDGYDGESCSECSAGFHDDGEGNCDLDEQCLANTCSGHGDCDDSDGTVRCSCNDGYVGDHCETCSENYHRDDEENCVEDEDCDLDDPCGEHGTCLDETGIIECICDLGYDGVTCAECSAGYHDDGTGTCVIDESCLPGTCSGHGECDASDGTVSCVCDVGYDGAFCDSCASEFHRDREDNCIEDEDCSLSNPCGDHGTCIDTTGVIECLCDIGYDGETCTECYSGYHDDGTGACVIDETCLAESCSGHGECDASDGTVSCICDTGYGGAFCTNCSVGYHRDSDENCVEDEDCDLDDPCGDHGTCFDTTGIIECICDIGYDGETCTECYPGYHDDGTGICVLNETCLPNTCSGHGECDDSGGIISCLCDDGYDGVYCDSCAVGYHDCSGECVPDDSVETCGDRCSPCPTDPNGRATCDGTTCGIECDEGWFSWGDACYVFCHTTVDPTPRLSISTGLYTSLEMDSSDRPHISYHFEDLLNQGLKYAHYSGTEWVIEFVGIRDAGHYTSLALDSSDQPHISYHRMLGNDLRYAYFTGTEWIDQHVESFEAWVGLHTSIAIDSSDNPHIGHYDLGNGDLRYTHYSGSEWLREPVDWEGDVGSHTSIALASDDNPHISYFDRTNRDLKYAYFTDTEWIIETVDTEGSGGSKTTIILDLAGYPHIGYCDEINLDLKYARFTGTEWIVHVVDSEGSVGQHASLALDSTGLPHFSYFDGTNRALKYAHFTGTDWIIRTVDSEGWVGQHTSIDLNSRGEPQISYHDYTNSELKYAWLSTDETCSM